MDRYSRHLNRLHDLEVDSDLDTEELDTGGSTRGSMSQLADETEVLERVIGLSEGEEDRSEQNIGGNWDNDEQRDSVEVLDGSTTRTNLWGRVDRLCPSCLHWIDHGKAKKSDHALQVHMRFDRCRKNIQQDKQAHEMADAEQAVAELRRIARQSTTEPICISVQDSPESRSTENVLTITTTGCPSIPLRWPSGSFFDTYPWQLHGYSLKSLGYHLCAVERQGTEFRVRSDNCVGVQKNSLPCMHCQQVTSTIAQLEERAKYAAPQTQYQYLTHCQLRDLLTVKNEQLDAYRLNSLNVVRKASASLRCLDDYRRFVMGVATYDVRRVRQLVAVAVSQGMGIKRIIERLKESADRVYAARQYDQQDFDMALLMLRVGGQKLLYATAHHFGLPALTTLRSRMDPIQFTLSIAAPKASEIDANIDASFSPRFQNQTAGKFGHSLNIDESSLNEQAVYVREVNKIGGLCREHASDFDLMITDLQSIQAIADAVSQPGLQTCHLGKEATVAGIAPFWYDSYDVRPILMSPTCKSETAKSCAQYIQLILTRWKESPHGEQLHGPIWSVASDGDATRRAAFYDLLMRKEQDQMTELGEIVMRLPGLNRFTGDNDVTMDFDPKHIFKRICTLIRSLEGIMISRTSLNRNAIAQYLERSGLTKEAVETLIDPGDPQNIPVAVRLMQAIIDASRAVHSADLDPSDRRVHMAMTLLAELFESLLKPFVDVTLSLSEQIACLSKYAHLCFVFFRGHGTSFMANQLYADSQSMVKNVIFCISKQQLLDPLQRLFLCQVGDDHLELLFGKVQMLGGHHPNVNISELKQHLEAILDILAIYGRNRGWDNGHRRLKLIDAEGIDHTNPASWIGNVVVGNINIQRSWAEGRSRAQTILGNIGFPFDFDTVLAQPGVDFLRPLGSNKYPGVSAEKDRSRDDGGNGDAIPISAHDSQAALKDGLEGNLEDKVADMMDIDESIPPLRIDAEAIDAYQQAPLAPNSDWILDGAKHHHKTTAIHIVFSSESLQKSTDRLRRVRSYTKCIKAPYDLDSQEITGPDSFHLGDIVGTLVRSADGLISLAILQVSALEQKGKRVSWVSAMVPTLSLRNSLAPEGLADEGAASSEVNWLWNGDFVDFQPISARASSASKAAARQPINEATTILRKSLIVSIPSHFTQVICPTILPIDQLPQLCPLRTADPSFSHTWSLPQSTMVILTGLLDQQITSKETLNLLPCIGLSGKFPYTGTGTTALNPAPHAFVGSGATQIASGSSQRHGHLENAECYQCGKAVPSGVQRRAHVGEHILRAMRSQAEGNLREPVRHFQFSITNFKLFICHIWQVGAAMPCGFCGRSTDNGRCTILLKKSNRTFTVISTCSTAHTFLYGPACKFSQSTPSTNIPIVCVLCHPKPGSAAQPAVWKYNMLQHLRDHHPGHIPSDSGPGLLQVPADFIQRITITLEEERKIGIPLENIPPTLFSALTAPTHSAQAETNEENTAVGADSPSDSETLIALIYPYFVVSEKFSTDIYFRISHFRRLTRQKRVLPSPQRVPGSSSIPVSYGLGFQFRTPLATSARKPQGADNEVGKDGQRDVRSEYRLDDPRRYLRHQLRRSAGLDPPNFFFLIAMGLPAGKLLDMGYFRQVTLAGSILYVFSLFMVSIAHPARYYQIFLSQGLGMGIGSGLLYVPAMAVQAHHWKDRRALAMGIVITGSSVGGIIFPIMLNQLFQSSAGFKWGVRASAFVVLSLLVPANILMSANPPPGERPKPNMRQILTDVPYMLSTLGVFCMNWGAYFPYFYLQLFAILHGVDSVVAFYTVMIILSAASIPGRVLLNVFADRLGAFNALIPSCFACGALLLALFGIKSVASTMIFAILYGFASGAFLSLLSPTIATLSKDTSEIGYRYSVRSLTVVFTLIICIAGLLPEYASGWLFFVTSFGALTGTPIDGALLGETFPWYKAIVFSA
ncbi:hypothetical protein EW146_g9475, partial [Bondarzewia mesenterica]